MSGYAGSTGKDAIGYGAGRQARDLRTALNDGAADLMLIAGSDAKRGTESDMRGCKFTPGEILFRKFLPLRESNLVP